MAFIDLDLLTYCRDADCDRAELHLAHGPMARAITAAKPAAWAMFTCNECGMPRQGRGLRCSYCGAQRWRSQTTPKWFRNGADVHEGVVEVTFSHIGTYVPVYFTDLRHAVVNDWGTIADKSIQRALAVLLQDRLVASIGLSGIDQRRRAAPTGWYIRYDSPKLWAPGGLRDLMSVAADQQAAAGEACRRSAASSRIHA